MFKNLFAALLICCMAFSVISVSGCGKKDDAKSPAGDKKSDEKKS